MCSTCCVPATAAVIVVAGESVRSAEVSLLQRSQSQVCVCFGSRGRMIIPQVSTLLLFLFCFTCSSQAQSASLRLYENLGDPSV